jgi:hypothetical protein
MQVQSNRIHDMLERLNGIVCSHDRNSTNLASTIQSKTLLTMNLTNIQIHLILEGSLFSLKENDFRH